LADDPASRQALGDRARKGILAQLDGHHLVAALADLG
jgi:hypothetical protein